MELSVSHVAAGAVVVSYLEEIKIDICDSTTRLFVVPGIHARQALSQLSEASVAVFTFAAHKHPQAYWRVNLKCAVVKTWSLKPKISQLLEIMPGRSTAVTFSSIGTQCALISMSTTADIRRIAGRGRMAGPRIEVNSTGCCRVITCDIKRTVGPFFVPEDEGMEECKHLLPLNMVSLAGPMRRS